MSQLTSNPPEKLLEQSTTSAKRPAFKPSKNIAIVGLCLVLGVLTLCMGLLLANSVWNAPARGSVPASIGR